MFFEHIIKKYSNSPDKEDKGYMEMMQDYLLSLIQNITEFLKDPDNFFKGIGGDINTSQPMDILYILDLMVTIFNRRLEWENEINKQMGKKIVGRNSTFNKNIKIYHKIIDRDNPFYKKVYSNKNL